MRPHKKPKDVIETLIDAAVLERICWGPGERQYHQRNKGPGYRVKELSAEDRALLSELKSDDIKNVRPDLLNIKCVCDNGKYK